MEHRTRKNHRTETRGYFVLLVLVFSAVFLTLISSLAGYIFLQKDVQLAKENREKALHLAEAGLEYYRWFLAHNPGDLQDGTGGPGPYQHTVADPEGGTLGTFSLAIEGETYCGQVSDVTIRSTGWTAADPTLKRTLSARYTRPSVADFSHIVDANVWAGDDRVINGPYHSNQGVRMDGTHNSRVTSGVETWSCTSTFGCNPTQNVDGVFGSGSQPALWEFPVPPVIDFGQVTVNLATLEGYAQNNGGIYLGPSGGYGYHITFLNDGRFEVRTIQEATLVWEFSSQAGFQQRRRVIETTSAPTVHTIPSSCPVVFAEDDVWVDGEVSGEVVLVAANIPDLGLWRTVTLNNNLTYANNDSGITVIGQQDVLVGLNTPNEMSINGVFIAQNGRFGRNHYIQGFIPSELDEFITRATLNTTGTVVSRGRVGTKWTSGGVFVSGYSQRNDSYDVRLSLNSPPFTPATSSDYLFREWQEVSN